MGDTPPPPPLARRVRTCAREGWAVSRAWGKDAGLDASRAVPWGVGLSNKVVGRVMRRAWEAWDGGGAGREAPAARP